jgi:hypothetical protein
MGCIAIIALILLIWWAVASPSTFFIGLFIFIGLCIWAVISNNKIKETQKQRQIKEDEKNNKIFEEKKIEYNISNDYKIVNYKNGFAKISKDKQYIWIKDQSLFLFPAVVQSREEKYILYKVPLKDIEYYSTQGNVSKQTKISGGGGEIGGSSVGGAIVGGVIAGGAGAVIGSRKKGKIESIKSEIITHDDRETFFNYYVNGERHSMFFDFKDYITLIKMIPEKDYNNFINMQLSKGSMVSVTEQLKDLADLKGKGIITEEEFSEKKKVLLNKIK